MSSSDGTSTTASTLRRAYATIEQLQRRLDELEGARSEPIAVVGLGCRLPGGIVDGNTYWDLLQSRTDAVAEVPSLRWDADDFYDERPQQPGKMSTRWGGFVDNLDQFDHQFFGISRREALSLDPQQRLTLMVAWEALEHAGIAPNTLSGSQTGVFMGVSSNDFMVRNLLGSPEVTAYASTGTSHSLVPARVSYLLDLRGPSIAIDSACSSSLVAVHQAVQSLRTGECDLALSGGVNVIMSPLPSIAFSQFPGMVSPDGRCRTFDASANGYVRSEGCAIVALKRLSDARRDGDGVLAVVRGGAVNQDGRSSGVTAPNGTAQREVYRRALEAAGVEAGRVSYIEAHGTGTRLGDPIEVDSLAEVYGRPDGPPVYLGSSKTNIGHLEAAAGIAGMVTTILALHHRTIPPNVHFEELNPHLSFNGTTFEVPTELTAWPEDGRTRVAAVSSFGFSGTNAHLILEEAEQRTDPSEAGDRSRSILALSAATPASLVASAERFVDVLSRDSEVDIADVCYSANTGRTHFRHRLAATGSDAGQLTDQLLDFIDGLPGDEPAVGEVGDSDVVFLCTGQGSQRVGMARTLYETEPVVREILDRCGEVADSKLDTPLLSVIYPEDPECDLISDLGYGQPAMFAIEFAMAELWRSWGIEPAAVMGHSLGEYVAACIAGVLSLEDAVDLVVERGRLMRTLAGVGTMAAVLASEDQVARAIAGHDGSLAIAAINGPANVVISGTREAVTEVGERFSVEGIEVKPLHIATASHSPLVDPILEPLRRAAAVVDYAAPRIPLVSNVTGELWAWDQAVDAEYWCRHARSPVRFTAGVATLQDLGYRNFLELGPAPTLLGLIAGGHDGGGGGMLLPSLRPNHDDRGVLLSSLGRLYANGADVNWVGFDRHHARRRVPLPTYPFEQTSVWPETETLTADDLLPTQPAQNESEPDDELFHRLVWQVVDEPPDQSADELRRSDRRVSWVVLADTTGVGANLVSQLIARGDRCMAVSPGKSFSLEIDDAGQGMASVRVDHPDDLGRVYSAAADGDCGDVHVVYLWDLDRHAGGSPSSVDQLLAEQELTCFGAVQAARALAGSDRATETLLWLVTCGATSAGADTATDPGGASLWGLGRSMQQELTRIWGGLIDTDPAEAPEETAAALLNEIGRPRGEDQVAFRSGRRLVARLERSEPQDQPTARRSSPAGFEWRPDAAYLVTGGLGGVGLAVARSMVAAGARHLILVGRRSLPSRPEWSRLEAGDPGADLVEAVRGLESLGADVRYEPLDIADEDGVRSFVERYAEEAHPPIRGVVHTAGTGDFLPLADLEPANLTDHMRAKAGGAWVLDQVFSDRSLDFFMLFSSASSVLSSPYVASYAAANAYLDGLAHARQQRHEVGLSVNWGVWADTGLARREAEQTSGLGRGMDPLDPEQALGAFHRLLTERQSAQVVVVPVDWSDWGRRYQEVSGSALLTGLVDGDSGLGAPRVAGRQGSSFVPTRQELLDIPSADRHETLTSGLLDAVAQTLGAGSSTPDPNASLFDVGLDSLMAVELRNEVESRLAVALPISLLLEGASVYRLAEHILDLVDDGGPTAAPATIPRVARVADAAAEVLAELDSVGSRPPRAESSREVRP